jgi:hypothetical protein
LGVAAALISLAGCSGVVSLHPFIAGQQAAFDPALLGVWNGDKEDTLYVIRQDGDGYKIRAIEGNETQSYAAKLFKVGDLRILDLTSTADDPVQVPVHIPIRVWVDAASLRFATLNSTWLKEHAQQLAVEDLEGRLLITAPGDTVLRFLIANGGFDEAYDKPSVLHRSTEPQPQR